MKIIGTPDSKSAQGKRIELRLRDSSGLLAVVHNDCIQEMGIRKRSGAIDFLDASLKAPRGSGLGILQDEVLLEVWHIDGTTEQLAGVFLTEYATAKVEETSEVVRIQGRSPCGKLIDQSLSLEFAGVLKDVLNAISSDGLALSEEIPEERVSCYFSAPSTFGAIRLLCTSAGLVARDGGSKLSIFTRSEVVERISTRSVPTLTDEDIRTASFSRGFPIRKRE